MFSESVWPRQEGVVTWFWMIPSSSSAVAHQQEAQSTYVVAGRSLTVKGAALFLL